MEWLKPTTAADVADVVGWAAARREGLCLQGRGTKQAIGAPVMAAFGVDLSALSGIRDYQPEELVLTAAAGTPLEDIETAVQAAGQHLPFEPYDLSGVLDFDADSSSVSCRGGTLGGLVSANLSGARRPFSGACRDHVLGVSGVGGNGLPFRAGGQVVKNVTGFDLSKLLTGAWGTLGILTEISLKVLPAPESGQTLLYDGLNEADAIRLMGRALRSPADVSGAAHRAGGDVALRLEGPEASVRWRAEKLRDMLDRPCRRLDGTDSRDWWQRWARLEGLPAGPDALVWKLSVVPTEAAGVVETLRHAAPDLTALYDWGGGLVWLAAPATLGGAEVRAAIPAGRGHATLIRAPLEIRQAGGVFPPEEAAVAALSRRLKDSFDPAGLFNPGKMR